ncbi:DNA-binding GntR family transcriptional regulator [Microbacterium sp. W4I4]|uniref:GntR family transcriptional regulator n=1 Tax=Microbacterium sp. W4I4 TaxID=3042295 RepID=UPI002783B526|nr:GntR family transcriptional regulator [Microbacterium sp. W4I4]MDQ0615527.1 DNA-binding GntR family transcriptional regulator [Microbacterium sp. W4I4]
MTVWGMVGMMVDVERPRMEFHDNDTKKQLLAEGVFRLIGERIATGVLAPGTRIRDADLASELAVSRTPVREALQRLERIGLVTMYPSRFTEVTALTPQAIEAAHDFAGYQAGIITRLACPRLTEADLATLSPMIARISASVDDSSACSEARGEVIGYLAARSGNGLQQMLVDESRMALARALRRFTITPAHRPQLIAGCAELDDALHVRDADAAERACRAIYGVD